MPSVELALVRITFFMAPARWVLAWGGRGDSSLVDDTMGYMCEADQGWCCGSGGGSLVMGIASDARLNEWYLLANAGKGLGSMSCLSG